VLLGLPRARLIFAPSAAIADEVRRHTVLADMATSRALVAAGVAPQRRHCAALPCGARRHHRASKTLALGPARLDLTSDARLRSARFDKACFAAARGSRGAVWAAKRGGRSERRSQPGFRATASRWCHALRPWLSVWIEAAAVRVRLPVAPINHLVLIDLAFGRPDAKVADL